MGCAGVIREMLENIWDVGGEGGEGWKYEEVISGLFSWIKVCTTTYRSGNIIPSYISFWIGILDDTNSILIH